jgi:prolipoprotein diacylglyceryltransferase
VPTAVVAFEFDPLLHVGDGAVRWETIALAAAIFVAIAVAGVAARSAGLRVDDLLFVVLGIVPGAVVGGRVGYAALHPAFFQAEPGRLLDPGVGSLELTLAVVGGTLTGSLVAYLLDGRPGPWLRIAALPMLVALAAGKLATVVGGTGQGLPTTGEPATVYLGPGPWGSLGPAIPAIPSQALEAVATTIVLLAVLAASLSPILRRPDGRLFVIALAGWSFGRVIVAGTWRDPVAVGPFRAEQAIALVVCLGATLVAVALIAGRQDEPDLGTGTAFEPAGPETR